MKLTFVNHACCKIVAGRTGLLCDPWIDGPAFNYGWDLLVPTPLSIDEILDGVYFIWISHEHPDHFAPSFLERAAQTHRDRITILFQKTRDQRVANYCRKLGFRVQELADRVPTNLSADLRVTCGNFDFYDSWLHVSDGRQSVLNLNDCILRSAEDLQSVAEAVGQPTLLLTQFSYAAWKGGKANRDFRDEAARQKLMTLAAQVTVLKPAYTLPFASMVYFSNVENFYLNDAVNTPRRAAETLAAAGTMPVVMYPGDTWDIGTLVDNAASLARYDLLYGTMDVLPRRDAGTSVDLAQLIAAFAQYHQRVFSRNARSLVWLLSQFPFLGAFQPLVIRLDDIDTLISLSLLDGLEIMPVNAPAPDVTMHSSSLLFILQNDFGYDTLTVNGRFEATPTGFSKMTRSLAIGSLNAMGLSISPRLIFEWRLVLILLRRLKGVMNRLTRGPVAESA